MSDLRSGKVGFKPLELREYIDIKAQNVVKCLIDKNLTLSTAESCTGGMISSAITSVSGASKVFECGIVSYSERIKEELLGVPHDIIAQKGVVSAETAIAMAKGVKKLSGSDISIAVTGLAGPAGDSDTLPVGTIFVSIAYADRKIAENLRLYELGAFNREINRLLTVAFALEMAFEALNKA